jgi:hypothetical protein
MASAERQSCQRRERQIYNRRSAEVNFRRFAADLRSTAIWWRRARFSSSRAARDWKIERTDARSVVRKIGMTEDYEGYVTLIHSDISTFSRGTIPARTIIIEY